MGNYLEVYIKLPIIISNLLDTEYFDTVDLKLVEIYEKIDTSAVSRVKATFHEVTTNSMVRFEAAFNVTIQIIIHTMKPCNTKSTLPPLNHQNHQQPLAVVITWATKTSDAPMQELYSLQQEMGHSNSFQGHQDNTTTDPINLDHDTQVRTQSGQNTFDVDQFIIDPAMNYYKRLELNDTLIMEEHTQVQRQ